MRCEGQRRYGGAFSLGPVHWEQCSNDATVMLTVEQDGETTTLPGCNQCWTECIENGLKVIEAKPIAKQKGPVKS